MGYWGGGVADAATGFSLFSFPEAPGRSALALLPPLYDRAALLVAMRSKASPSVRWLPGRARAPSAFAARVTSRLTPSQICAIVDVVSYPGGKAVDGVYQRLINQIPPHRVYIEPFLGGGAIMLRKRAADVNIGVDVDDAALAAFGRDAFYATGRFGDGLAPCTLVHGDGISFLRGYNFVGSEFVYCDPPYLMSTRRDPLRSLYRYELSEVRHRDLLTVLTAIPAAVMISGYWSELYASTLAAWRTDKFPARTRGHASQTEWLWMNYPEPVELHDYSFVGSTYRERERIKRKIKSWKHMLAAMPDRERGAVLAALGVRGVGSGLVV